MFRRKKSDAITYGIVGLGRFGYALAMELAAFGADIMVMDSDEDKVRAMREYTEDAYVVKSHDKKTLSETGIQNCDIAIVCMGEKMDTSILNTLTLVSLGIPKVIAKASSAEHGEILERLGAEVVYPERDMALRLAHRLESSSVLDFVQLSEKVNISQDNRAGQHRGQDGAGGRFSRQVRHKHNCNREPQRRTAEDKSRIQIPKRRHTVRIRRQTQSKPFYGMGEKGLSV